MKILRMVGDTTHRHKKEAAEVHGAVREFIHAHATEDA